jgi:hypothetical protein
MVGSLNCNACGYYVAPIARVCPQCGRKRRSVKRLLGFVVAAEVALLGAGVYWWQRPKSEPPPVQHLAAADAMITNVISRGDWTFYTTHDGAVNDLTRHARISAEATGATKAILELRDSATYGKIVLITFPTVPSACRTNRCAMTASFDQGQAQPYDITIDSEADTTTVEVPQFDAFVDHLAEAHDLALTVMLGTAQDIVLRFKVAGFDWA